MQLACDKSLHTTCHWYCECECDYYGNQADLQCCKLLLLPLQMLLSCIQLTGLLCKMTLTPESLLGGVDSLVQGLLQDALQLSELAQGILPVSLSSGLCAQGGRSAGHAS